MFAFIETMRSVITRYRWCCYAFCLMKNHFHLVIETPQANLSQGMRQLNGTWAQRFNKRHKSVGHLFQSRFNSYLIEPESYLLEVLRYVVLNPVRAKICKEPGDYIFSSYRQTAGLDRADGLLQIDWVLRHFGGTRPRARQAYQRFVSDGIRATRVFDHVKAGVFLGSEDFVAKHTLLLADERLGEIPKTQRHDPRPTLAKIFSGKPRIKKEIAKGAHRAYVEWGYTMKQIADYLGVHYATISRAIKQYETSLVRQGNV